MGTCVSFFPSLKRVRLMPELFRPSRTVTEPHRPPHHLWAADIGRHSDAERNNDCHRRRDEDPYGPALRSGRGNHKE